MRGVGRVIVCGVRRAGELVPAGEIQQAVGRAGRSASEPGEAVVVCGPDDAAYADECLNSPPPPVRSRLSGADAVAFHLLPWTDSVGDEASYAAWCGRTLAGLQGVPLPPWGEVLGYMRSTGCVDGSGSLTEFGRISVSSYFTPAALCRARRRLGEIGDPERFDEYEMSYLFGALADGPAWLPKGELPPYDDFTGSLHGRGFLPGQAGDVECFLAWCAMTGLSVKPFRHAVAQVRNDFGRMAGACRRLAECDGLRMAAKWIETGGIMAERRVPYEIASIIREFGGLSRRSAMELDELGIRGFEELTDNMESVLSNGSDDLRKELARMDLLVDTEVEL